MHVVSLTCMLACCQARLLGVMQALAEQRVQVESGMNSYGLEIQQASLTVLAWQAHMAGLHATTRCS
jgi:hypothetical protein